MLDYVHESLRCDRALILSVLQRDGGMLRWACESIKYDHEIVLVAVKSNGLVRIHSNTMFLEFDQKQKYRFSSRNAKWFSVKICRFFMVSE